MLEKIRMPNAEIRKKPEARSPKNAVLPGAGLRISDFGI
jgi:hypothetical protein